MEPPNIPTVVRDQEKNITYIVLAWRPLTPAEAKFAVQNHLRICKRKPKPNETRTITTILDTTILE